jgi:hypothetical protein
VWNLKISALRLWIGKEWNPIDNPIYFEISRLSIRFQKKYFDCEYQLRNSFIMFSFSWKLHTFSSLYFARTKLKVIGKNKKLYWEISSLLKGQNVFPPCSHQIWIAGPNIWIICVAIGVQEVRWDVDSWPKYMNNLCG